MQTRERNIRFNMPFAKLDDSPMFRKQVSCSVVHELCIFVVKSLSGNVMAAFSRARLSLLFFLLDS